MSKKNKNTVKNIKKPNPYAVMVIVTLLLEIFVFNFRFIQSLGYKTIDIINFECLDGIERLDNGNYKIKSSGSREIELDNINAEVKNIYLDIYDKRCMDEENRKKPAGWDFQKLAIVVCATDEGNKNYFDLPERFVVQGAERTKYIKMQTSGVSKKLKLRFNGSDDREIVINSIKLNKRLPFSFNIIRLGFVFLLIWLGYILRRGSAVYEIRLKWDYTQKCAIMLAIAVNIALSAMICLTNPAYAEKSDQYDELAKAFINKQLYLEEEPPDTLKNMENPYDTAERDIVMRDNGTFYKWDHAYYNGKYYVYFGALPALIYYVPCRLINDKEFYTANGILINICFYTVFVYLLLKAIADRWFKGLPFVVYMLLCQTLVFSSGMIFGLRKADFYSMPITMALALVAMGLYFWISSDGCRKNTEKTVRIALGSLFMALVAGCRPQFLMMSFIAVPLFWKEVFRDRTLFSEKSASQTAAFILPYIAAAAVVMWYNHARFGSVFDFGANYNLTTNDMTVRGFRLDRIPLGVFAYFFQPPVVYPKFPFVTGVNLSNYYMGKTITEFMCGGVFATQPVLWPVFALKAVKKELRNKGLLALTLCLLVFSLIIGIADTEMAGILCRYYMDLSYPVLIAAAISAFALCEKYRNKDTAYYITVLAVLSLVFDFIEMFLLADSGHEINNPNFYYTITSALTFWM